MLPGWSGSAGISGGGLQPAAAELDAATLLFVGRVGEYPLSWFHIFKIEICCNNRVFAILGSSTKWRVCK